MIYLAGPIDKVSFEDASGWRKFVTNKISAPVFDPFAAFGRKQGGQALELIQTINENAILQCSGMLVNASLPGGDKTWEEVRLAEQLGLFIVYYTGELENLVNIPKWANEYSDRHVFDSITDAIHATDKLYQKLTRDRSIAQKEKSAEQQTLLEDDIVIEDDVVVEDSPTDLDDMDTEAQHQLFDRFNEWWNRLDRTPQLLFKIDREACRDFIPILPSPAYEGDVGFDLPCSEEYNVQPGSSATVRLAFRIAPPPGFWWRMASRSSTWHKLGLIVYEGNIDSGYRGPLWVGVFNPTSAAIRIRRGDKLVQAIIHKIHDMDPILVKNLPVSERGVNGFGSSGK